MSSPEMRQLPTSSQQHTLGQDLSSLQEQAQQSPANELKTSPEVQQDIHEGENLIVF